MALMLIHIYRYLASPWLGNQCRFYPSCSHYAEEAIQRFGVIKGAYLALRRLLRCHPWHQGGLDPVPDSFTFRRCRHPNKGSIHCGNDYASNPTINLPTIKK